MRCHYDILSLERNASGDEIKKRYRELALKHHPDKNLEDSEASHEEFVAIQQSYHVLIDPQERAWYDKHRDAILKGGLGDDYKDDSLNVFQYFNASCYRGYGDDEKSFYTVYREVFERLAEEDRPFLDPDDGDEAPGFGDSQSHYSEVVHMFYSHWQTYFTKKTYSWLDRYDIREAENRRVVRLMEKENKRLRDAARRERNEEVRQLVAFVRKRDKRVEMHRKELEERAKEIQRKVEEKRRRDIEERLERLANYRSSNLVDEDDVEARLRDLEKMYSGGSTSESSDSDEDGDDRAKNNDDDGDDTTKNDDDDDENADKYGEDLDAYDSLHCLACNKVFRSAKAFTNHERSKKHRENVENLRNELLSEDLDHLEVASSSGDDVVEQGGSKKLSKRQKKQRRLLQKQQKPKDGSESDVVNDLVDAVVDACNNDDVDATQVNNDATPSSSQPRCDEVKSGLNRKQKGKNKKKHVALPSSSSLLSSNSHVVEEEEEDTGPKPSRCEACGVDFPSRSKLFDHLKQTGHATVKPRADVKDKARRRRGGKARVAR